MKKKNSALSTVLTVFLSILCVAWIYPIVMILLNSFKVETAISTSGVFQLPNAATFAGLANYVNAVGSKGFLSAFGTSMVPNSSG